MLCQHCNAHPATTHIKRLQGGQLEELYLCADCARDSVNPGLGFALSDLFSGFLGHSVKQQPAAQAPIKRCDLCGASLQEIAKSSCVGCAKCYDTFYLQLEPTLQRIHGSLTHTGKTPEDSNPDRKLRREREQTLASLREQITHAIKAEDYEQAATLRDEIRKLEGGDAKHV